jgi:putative intracellular protease/amidase
MNEDARKFVKAIDSRKKPIAVICHGAWLLASAGLVKGRHLTSYYTSRMTYGMPERTGAMQKLCLTGIGSAAANQMIFLHLISQ